MNRTLIVLLLAALVSMSCKGRLSDLRRDQQNYETVEEGNASGVAATLNAPGEPPPTLPSLTGTNTDPTNAFTLPGGMTTTDTTAGTLAGTLPTNQRGGVPYGYPSDAPVRRAPRPPPEPPTDTAPATTTAEPLVTPESSETVEPKQPATQPAPTEEPEPAPPTSTDTRGARTP